MKARVLLRLMEESDAIDQFLQRWYENARSYYLTALERAEKISPYTDDTKRVTNKDWSEAWQILQDLDSQIWHMNKDNKEKIEAKLKKEVVKKKKDFIARIEKKVGKIESTTKLSLDSSGNINGEVQGELGKAKVNTIMAGGPIQRLHYRVLVK